MAKFCEALKKSNAYRSFERDVDGSNAAHAYMLSSPDDVALKSLAELCVIKLFCPDGNDEVTEQRIFHRNHSDVKFVNEEGKKIKVEDVNDLVEDSIIRPNEGDKKVYVICYADLMNAAAQNKLLKTLEEPADGVVFLLLTQNEAAMLDTVKSRVRKVVLESFSSDVVYSEIFALTGNTESAEVAAACSDGMLGKAEKIALDESYKAVYAEAFELLGKLQKSADVASLLNRKVFVKENFGILLDILSIIFRDMLVLRTGSEVEVATYRKEDVLKLSESFSDEAVGKIIYLLNDERKKLFFNVSTAAVAENLLMGILQIKYTCKK